MFISDYLPFAFVALAAAMVCGVIALYAWKRRHGPGIRDFALLMAALTWASLMSAVEYTISAQDLTAKVFASQLYLIGASAASVLALLFAARYTHHDGWLRRPVVWLLWAPVVLELALVFTNHWHHLYWPTVTTTSGDAAARVVFGHGLITNLLAVFGYTLILLATALLLWSALHAPPLYRWQSTMFVLAVLAPLATNIVYYFDLGPWQDFDFTPVAFAITGVLLAFAVFRYQAVELTPVALDTLFANLRDGVLVVNERGLIVNANPAARLLLALPEAQLLGRAIETLPPPWQQALQAVHRGAALPQEVELQGALPARTIEVTVTALHSRNAHWVGSMIALHDVTIHRNLQRSLAQANVELEQRVATRTAELAAMRDSLAQHVANLSSHLSVLYEVILLGGQTVDIEAVRDQALEIVITSLQAEAGFIMSWDTAAQIGNVTVSKHIEGTDLLRLVNIPADWLFGESVPHTILDIHDDNVPPALRLPGMVACLTTAVRRQNMPVAAIGIFWRQQPALSVEAIALFRALADQLAILAENARLRQIQNESLVQEERNRLARDLHDSVTQALYALALYAETTANAVHRGRIDQLDQRMDRIAAAARQALREMRLLLYELRPAAQQSTHVAESLLLRLDAVESRAGISVHADIDENLVLPPAWEADVYWIAIEALNNSLKHASAKRVHVRLAHEQDSLVLLVEDDGPGIPPEQVGHALSGGLGLRSMQDRARRLGGCLDIMTSPLGGVAVHLRIAWAAAPEQMQSLTYAEDPL
jgi:signal transduction histidine kinase